MGTNKRRASKRAHAREVSSGDAAQGAQSTAAEAAPAGGQQNLQQPVPTPPQSPLVGPLSGGNPARLLRTLRSRCPVSGNTAWMELLALTLDPVTQALPRLTSHQQVQAARATASQLPLRILLLMMGDSQHVETSALALAALGELLFANTKDELDAMQQRRAAATAHAAEQQTADCRQPAAQHQAADQHQVAEHEAAGQRQSRPDERQNNQASDPPPQQQPASPQRAVRRTLKAYRQQLDELQRPQRFWVDIPFRIDPTLRKLAPQVASCLKRHGLLDALDGLGACAVAPHLVCLMWRVYDEVDSAWHDMSVALLQHYIPQIADTSTPAGRLGAASPMWLDLVDILRFATPPAVAEQLAADSSMAPALLEWADRMGQQLDALDTAPGDAASSSSCSRSDAAAAADVPPGASTASSSNPAAQAAVGGGAEQHVDRHQLLDGLAVCTSGWRMLQGEQHKPHAHRECTLLAAAIARMVRHIGSSPSMPATLYSSLCKCLHCALRETPAEATAEARSAQAAAAAALAAAAAGQLQRCCRDVPVARAPAAAAATAAQMAVLGSLTASVHSFLPPVQPGSRRAMALRLLIPLQAVKRCAFWLDAGEDVRGLPPAGPVFFERQPSSSAGPETLGVHAELAADKLTTVAANAALQLLHPTAAAALGQDPAECLASRGFFKTMAAQLRRQPQLAAWHLWNRTTGMV